MRRSTAALLVIAAVPALLVVPTFGPSAAEPHPVAPKLATLSLRGVDAAALEREQRAPAAADPDVPAAARTARPAVLTAPTGTTSFSLVGVTWDTDQPSPVEADDLTVTVRTHSQGRWQPWAVLPTDSDDRPSEGEGVVPVEGAEGVGRPARVGTSPYYSGPSDGVQVRVDTDGPLPAGLRVDLVDPGTSAADTRLVAAVPSAAEAATGMPAVITRKQWGADESLRNGSPTYEPRVKVAFVHHTATSNSYTKDQAAAAIRSIYAYDTKSLGWSDIAYNVLVDRYGQVFEGRAGGLDRAVRSAATGGFNAQSWSVSALGNYQDTAPTTALVSSISKVLAWKLGIEHLDPNGTNSMTAADGSGTTAKYPNGTKVTFPVISGHRDAGSTACPGALLYAKLPTIRSQVAELMGAGLYGTSASPLLVPKGSTTPVRVKARALTAQSWRLEVKKQGSSTVLRSFDGTVAQDGLIDVSWDLENSDGDTVKPGVYTVTLQSWNATSVAVPYAVNVGLFADPDVYDRPADGVFHLEGRGYGHGHGMSQFGAEGAARKGLTRDQILAFYYPGTTQATASPTQTMRVSLSSAVRTTPAGYDVRLRAATGLRVSESGRALVLPPTLGGKTVTSYRVFFSSADKTVSLYGWTGSYQPVPGWTDRPGPLRFTTALGAPTTSRLTLLRTTGAETVYRGVIEVRPNASRTGLTAISEVLLDDYVKSVVSAEMPGGWTDTAYQAQAVAARSYAMSKRTAAVAAGSTTHICDTTSCQVYNGYSGETSPESKAATATAGIYLTYGGVPIFAEFGSANGGWSASGGKPYLVAKADPYDGVVTGTANWGHAWTKDVSASTIQSAYPSIGSLQRIVVVDRDGNGEWGGRVTSVRLEGSKADVTVSGTALRSALGLKSEWFRAQQVPPAPPPVVVPTAPPTATGVPGAVTGLKAVAADRSAVVSWTAPTKAGSSAITGYRITVNPGARVVSAAADARTLTVPSLVNGRSYSFSVVARNAAGSSTAAATSATPTSLFGYPVTLPASTAWAGVLPAGRTQSVKVLGVAGVPTSNVASVTLRVQASSATGGLVSATAAGATSTAALLTVPKKGSATNLVVVPVGTGGAISVSSTAATTVSLDVVGYDTRSGGVGRRLVPVVPERLGSGPVGPIPLTVPVVGVAGVPTKTSLALVQLSVSAGAFPVTVQVSPDGTTAKAVPAVSVPAGSTRTVPVLAPVGSDGAVRVLGTGAASVAVDLYGYYVKDDGLAAAGRTRTVPISRIFDSRSGGGAVPAAGSTVTIPVLGVGSVPKTGVSAVILNVIAFTPASNGSLRVFPAGVPLPAVRSLSFDRGATVRTTVIAKVGAGGAVQAYLPSGGSHLIVDLTGYVTG